MKLIKDHKQAFSLRDEIGKCPDIKIDIDVIDDSHSLLDHSPYMKKINP